MHEIFADVVIQIQLECDNVDMVNRFFFKITKTIGFRLVQKLQNILRKVVFFVVNSEIADLKKGSIFQTSLHFEMVMCSTRR